jgi:hypothetical protein
MAAAMLGYPINPRGWCNAPTSLSDHISATTTNENGKNLRWKLILKPDPGSTTLVAAIPQTPYRMWNMSAETKHAYKLWMWNMSAETKHAYKLCAHAHKYRERDRWREHLPSRSRKDVFVLFIPVPLNNFTSMGLFKNKDQISMVV